MKNYFAKLRENEEKGFSLVELIIVMAIMAILVGVVASQVIPYMEKSRQSKDQQQLSGLVTDITASLASAAVTAQDVTDGTKVEDGIAALAADTADGTKIEQEFCDLRNGASSVSDAIDAVKAKLKSKAAKDADGNGEIYMEYKLADSKLTLYMKDSSGNKINKLTAESE